MLRSHSNCERKLLLTLEEVSPAMGLLFELPSHGLSPHISNLRQNLLRSLGVAIDDENRTSTEWKAFIDGNPLDQHNGLFNKSGTGHLPHDRYQHTLAIKLDVGQWMRQKLFNYSESGQAPFQQPQENTKTGARDPQHSIFDESRFRTVLAVLEDLEDFTAIVDLLLFHSKSSDPQLLTAIAVTISHYSDVFLACRKADTTFVRLMQRHADLNGKPGYLALTEALIDLAECLPNRSREARLLRTERQRHESKLSVAACSPISEHMAEALQIENSESSLPCTDDIEQLLASGTSMDKQLLTDVFGLIWKRFEIAWGESIQSGFTAAGLLTRLRPFDVNAVNEMTLCRVDEVLTSGAPGTRKSMWISLICARVISFEQLLSHVKNALKQMDDLGVQCELLAETVGCLTMGRQRADSSISHVRPGILPFKHLILTHLTALLPILHAAAEGLTWFFGLSSVFTAANAPARSRHPARHTREYLQAPARTCIHGNAANTPQLESARPGKHQGNFQPYPHDGPDSTDTRPLSNAVNHW